MKIALFTSLSLLVAGAVASETTGEYTKPVDRQWDTGNCDAFRVQQLQLATDPNNPLQAQHLMAAEAYLQLRDSGQTC